MAPRFLDTNILVRLFTRDDEDKAERVFALLRRVEHNEEQVAASAMVIFETIFVLEKRYNTPRGTIRDRIKGLISSAGLRLADKEVYRRALDLYAGRSISFADAYNAEFMRSRRLSEIYTWDTDFDHLEGIARVEPELTASA